MKTCKSCNTEKSLDDFHKRSKAKDGRQHVCKDCNKRQRKEYYRSAHGRKTNSLSGKRWKHQQRYFLYEYLKTQSCAVCGESDPVVLEFDHINGKTTEVSKMVGSVSKETLLAEIQKCQVLCANCHRRKTAIDFNWYNFTPL